MDETASSHNPPQSTHSAPQIIALVGFMGAGKTTVGQAIAAKLNWRFADLDDLVQARDGRTIPEIFEQSGEGIFRELEHQLLSEFVQSSDARCTVLSLGGGAFIDNTNQRLLGENGIRTVFLDAPAEELFRRCAEPGVSRPLLRDRDRFGALLAQRRPEYLKAALCIQTAGRDIASIVDEIVSRFGLSASSGASP